MWLTIKGLPQKKPIGLRSAPLAKTSEPCPSGATPSRKVVEMIETPTLLRYTPPPAVVASLRENCRRHSRAHKTKHDARNDK